MNKNVPNILSFVRILVAPVVLVLLCVNFYLPMSSLRAWVTAILYLLASSTDSLDGYLARKYNAVSNMGKFIDPIADKLLVLSVLVFIVGYEHNMWITVIAVISIAREFIISAFRLVAASSGDTIIAADMLGKLKAVAQSIAMTAYLLIFVFGALAQTVFWVFLVISAVLSVLSCVNYIKNNWHVLVPSKGDAS
jgi:CDP-diacylglycerol--glycerol-3-phosphate 3-phosphatidyltransferase